MSSEPVDDIAERLERAKETIAILRVQIHAFTTERNEAESKRQRAVMLKKQAETQTTRALNRSHELACEVVHLQKELQKCKESTTAS